MQAEVILGIKREEGIHGREADEPEEDGEEDAQSAFIFVGEYFAQAFEHAGLLFCLFVFLRLFNEEIHDERGQE